MSQNLEALVVELRADIKGFQASLQAASANVSRFTNKANKDVDSFQASVKRARDAVLALGIGIAAFKVGKGIIDAGVQMQALQNRMLAATGSAQVAAAGMEYVRSESERLGLSLAATGNGFAGFAASALRAGLTFGQTKDIFTGVSEAATSMHLSVEQTSLVFKALEQMAGKGTVSMEELRGQLGDVLPGAFEIAAKAMGKTTAEFTKLVSNGQVAAADFLPKFGEAIRRELGGSVDDASKSAQAAFNRLANAWLELQAKMANAGFIDAVTMAVNEMTAQLNDPQTVEGLKGLASMMADIVVAATKAAAALGQFYGEANKAIEKAGDSAFGTIFGQKGADAIANARREKYLNDNEGRMTDDLRQRVLSEFMAKQKPATKTTANPDSYTLGTIATPVASDTQKKAQEKAQKVREQLSSQVDSMRYNFANPSDQAAMDVEKQQKILKEALDAKAITEQEYRDLSLEAETEYQDKLKDIRDKAREEELSAFEGFLGIRFRSEEEMREDSIADQAKSFRDTISQAANHNRAFFALEKAAAIARALLAARESVVSAYNFGARLGGPPLGAAFAGVAAAAQAANIAAIASTSFNSGSSSIGSNSSSSGSSSTEQETTSSSSSATAGSKEVHITLNGSGYNKNDIRDLIDQLNDAMADGSQLKIVGVNA